MHRTGILAVGCALAFLVACGAAQQTGSATGHDLHVACEPACYVYVDGVLRGRAEPHARIALEAGAYRVLLVEPGYLDARYDVLLGRRDVELVHAMWPAVVGVGDVR